MAGRQCVGASDVFGANPVRQLFVPAGVFHAVGGENGAMEVRNNYGGWPASPVDLPMDDGLWSLIQAPATGPDPTPFLSTVAASFDVTPEGLITPREWTSSGGKWPWFFALNDDSRMIVANDLSDNIIDFDVTAGGELTPGRSGRDALPSFHRVRRASLGQRGLTSSTCAQAGSTLVP